MATLLEQAVALIRAGNIEQARPLLIEWLKQNPQDEDAWLWMSRCVTETEQKKFCFEKVLKINPQNQYAIKGLEHLIDPISPKTQPRANVVQQPQPPKKKGRNTGLSAAVIIGLGVAAIAFICMCAIVLSNSGGGSNSSVPTKDESGGGTMAYVMCQKFIEEQLVAPATADWPSTYDIEIYTVRGKTNAYQIRGYVDAENRMGAFIRNRYVCEVSYVGNDKWHLDYLKFEE